MYEYKFEKVYLSLSSFNSQPLDDYHEIIQKHAQDGWRFVQIFAPSLKETGQSSYFEMIFERAKQD